MPSSVVLLRWSVPRWLLSPNKDTETSGCWHIVILISYMNMNVGTWCHPRDDANSPAAVHQSLSMNVSLWRGMHSWETYKVQPMSCPVIAAWLSPTVPSSSDPKLPSLLFPILKTHNSLGETVITQIVIVLNKSMPEGPLFSAPVWFSPSPHTAFTWLSAELECRCALEFSNHRLGASRCSALVFNSM